MELAYLASEDTKSEALPFQFAVPYFEESKLFPSLLTPGSPQSYFGNQAQLNSWYQNFDNLALPKSPTTHYWMYQSEVLNEIENNNCYSPLITKISFPFQNQLEQSLRQGELDNDLPRDGCSYFKLHSQTEGSYKENVLPGGGSRISNELRPRGQKISDVRDFTYSTQLLMNIKSEEPTSTTNNLHHGERKQNNNSFHGERKQNNNAYHGERKQSHKEELKHRDEKDGGAEEEYARKKRYRRGLRQRYSSGISAKDLKLFTKSIGFKSSADGTHDYICELLDFVIESKRVYRVSTCPRGSKFLQHQIINAHKADRNEILQQVMEKLVSICNESYGNYVVQCFFMLSNPEIEKEILQKMRGSLCLVAMNQYGCRVLQKAIPTLNDELFGIVIDAIAPNTYTLALHSFGSHVLQRAIERGTGEAVRAMLQNVTRGGRNRLVKLAKNSFGCRIIQRMLEKALSSDRVAIIEAIMDSPRDLLTLCMDEFGNYVLQHIVNNYQAVHTLALMEVLDGRLLKMAKNKFCSNVLEVLYKRGGRDVEDRLIKQVDVHFLKECLNDRFANYLVQTMLMEGDQENRDKIRKLLQTIPDLKGLKYGKFVIYRLCRLNRSSAKED